MAAVTPTTATPTRPRPQSAALSVSADSLALARRASWLAAKAKALATDIDVIALTENTYVVLGGQDYIVARNGIKYTCNCPAGLHNKPCYHAAKVALLPHEEYHRKTVRAALAEAAHQTKPACPGYLKAHAAVDGVSYCWCRQCDEEGTVAA